MIHETEIKIFKKPNLIFYSGELKYSLLQMKNVLSYVY